MNDYLYPALAFVAVAAAVLWLAWPRQRIVVLPGPKHIHKDDRQHPRQSNYNSVRVFVTCPILSRLMDGWVIDTSATGIGMMVSEFSAVDKLAIERVWCVKPASLVGTDSWVRLRIKNAVKEGNSWRLGCKFEDDIPKRLRQALAGEDR